MTRSVVIGGYDITIPAGRDPSTITPAEAAEIRRAQIMARAEAVRRECGEPVSRAGHSISSVPTATSLWLIRTPTLSGYVSISVNATAGMATEFIVPGN